MIVDHRRLVASKNRVRLRARLKADLDAAPGWEVLPCDDVEHKLHILAPVHEFLLGGRGPRNIERKLHHSAINTGSGWKDPREFDVIALQHEDRIGEQRVDKCRVPHEVPGRFWLGL